MRPRALIAGNWVRCITLWVALTTVCVGAPWDAPPRKVVSRSDIFVGQPNVLPSQAMPLGNGRLGVAVWAADGMTLQLNRSDTLPGRLSPGQVIIPGLKRMTADRAFTARLKLFDGEWYESGAGMSARVIVDRDWDRVIIDVEGANPAVEQTVLLNLWEPRAPQAIVSPGSVMLAEHWLDNKLPGASGLPFGSLAAMRVIGRNVVPAKIGTRTVALRFRPLPDGRFRVIVAAPAFDGTSLPAGIAAKTLLAPVQEAASRQGWNDFWKRAGLITGSSADGHANYFETLRMLFLFASAAESRGVIPGSQAGIADLFSAVKDAHQWDPAAFWAWNLRMQVAANLSAGLPELNEPFFALYRNNLDALHRWTIAKMNGRDGICVPETMRFNGVGIEYGSTEFRPFEVITHGCDAGWSSTSNARTLTTGAEVALWVWETYLKTKDRSFLEANYALMSEAARFLLAYQQPGSDGLLHTHPSNAHETQHDVIDPSTDLSAIRMLYPATIKAAAELGQDAQFAQALAAALEKTPQLPLTNASGVADAVLADRQTPGKVIAASYDVDSPARNDENIGLEPVWPYGLITRDSALYAVAQRTYAYRPFRNIATWSLDPVHAARLGLGVAVAQSLYSLTQLYQTYPNGMADFGGGGGEFYIEQMAVTALTLTEALVQDQGDTLRIAPAVPPGWSLSGTVYVRGDARVSVDMQSGNVTGFELVAQAAHEFRIANPWGNRAVSESVSGAAWAPTRTDNDAIVVSAEPGKTYRFQAADAQAIVLPLEQTPPLAAKSLGRAGIGLGPPCCAPPPGYNPASDRLIGKKPQ
jgi:alpha-L-fucosidase 2